jgi:hypothetical protein
VAIILPKPCLIIDPAKVADMVCISSKVICEGNDFSQARSKKAKLPMGKTRGHQVEKSLYALDIEGFWLDDNSRMIAETFN